MGALREVEGGVGAGSLAAECAQSGESVSALSCSLLTSDVGRSEHAPQRGWIGCPERQSRLGRGTQTGQEPRDSLPVGRGASLFPQPPGRGGDTHWLWGPVFPETQGGAYGFRDWSGCLSKWPSSALALLGAE